MLNIFSTLKLIYVVKFIMTFVNLYPDKLYIQSIRASLTLYFKNIRVSSIAYNS